MNEWKEVFIHKVLQTKAYSVIVVGDDEKQFSIYMEPHIGEIIQQFFSNEKSERPQTYDFLDRLLLGFDISIKRVLIHKKEGSIFFSKILCEQNINGTKSIVEIDARPSDSLILALRHKVPVFCSHLVFDETIAYVE